MIGSMVGLVAAFLLGVVATVVAGLLAAYLLLSKLESGAKEFKQRKDLVEASSLRYLSHRKPSEVRLEAYMKVQSWAISFSGPNKATPWAYGALRGNTIYIYADGQKEVLVDEISLHGCTVSVTSKNWASVTNAVEIAHDERHLLSKERTKKVCLYFTTGWELERWYWAVHRGCRLHSDYEALCAEEELLRKNFSELRRAQFKQVGDSEEEAGPLAWANALLPRFWWNIYDNKSFHKFIMKRLGKRIAKITDFPKFIQSMILKNIHIGPNLPDITSIRLIQLTDDGGVEVDATVDYKGGLSLEIQLKTSMQLPGTSLEVPASVTIEVKHLHGKLRIHVSPPPCQRFWVGFYEMPAIDVTAETQIGTGAGTSFNVPKMAGNIIKKLRQDITRIIVNKLKSDIIGEKMVLPNMDDFPLPYFTHREGEEDEDYVSQVILSRDMEEEKKKAASVSISPAGVTILNKRIESDQIVPLIKSYASKDGVRKLRQGAKKNMPSKTVVKENMEKGKQALIESGMTNPKNWRDIAAGAGVEEIVGGIRQYTGFQLGKRESLPIDQQLLLQQAAMGQLTNARPGHGRHASVGSEEEMAAAMGMAGAMAGGGGTGGTFSPTGKKAERSGSIAGYQLSKKERSKELAKKEARGKEKRAKGHARIPSADSAYPGAATAGGMPTASPTAPSKKERSRDLKERKEKAQRRKKGLQASEE
eukprot:CAMPEP_0114625464 /NCGR_PEP_ID=MMETSP0168-20121206/11283_1 /TAXON_ID=95228 ORGANISM="Vannella sp., Strain DIVA3 517/6/12" /NCGR_SAMPLE_ID=MMETSP0168 /ASSEMBLY_ACC=CAM_ASM_000044 /LENGTH=702 /DNA_ID=CAMNT_0001836745 /DNA_START=195 /DNA_END=2301 /DNA_ORIENTATION=+